MIAVEISMYRCLSYLEFLGQEPIAPNIAARALLNGLIELYPSDAHARAIEWLSELLAAHGRELRPGTADYIRSFIRKLEKNESQELFDQAQIRFREEITRPYTKSDLVELDEISVKTEISPGAYDRKIYSLKRVDHELYNTSL